MNEQQVGAVATFGEWLRQQRKALDLTQAALADQIGCSLITIRKIESGTLRPSAQIAGRLVACFGVSAPEQAAFVKWARGLLTPPPTVPTASPPAAGALTLSLAPLPVSLTPIIGREQELALVRGLLWRSNVRLVTLTGPPGIGKTRLALDLAAGVRDDFPDGAAFVPLAALTDPALVSPAIAAALGVRVVSGEPLADTLTAALRERQMLLVLDNFEQLMGATAGVLALLGAAPGLKILLTSREALRVRGERVVPVPTLAVPGLDTTPALGDLGEIPAVALFVGRAQEVQYDFVLTAENAGAVAGICRRLEGLPLALELAATRIAVLAPDGLLSRLESRLSTLDGGLRDLPPHQQTLRAALAWSYDLLTHTEQRLFAHLSVFTGGWTLAAAEAVVGDAPSGSEGMPPATPRPQPSTSLLTTLESLVAKSLVGRGGAPDSPRFQMLELVCEYAAEQLAARGEAGALRARHAAHFQALAAEAAPHLGKSTAGQWLAQLDHEADNLRAALGWLLDGGESEAALQMMLNMYRYWVRHGPIAEGVRWLQRGLGGATVASLTRARALSGLGGLWSDLGDYAQARVAYEESLALYRILDDPAALAAAFNRMGVAILYQGDLTAARALFSESLALGRTLDARWPVTGALINLGLVAYEQGDYPAATDYWTESLARAVADNGPSATAHSHQGLGQVAYQQGDLAAARTQFHAALTLFQAAGSKMGMIETLEDVARVDGALGQEASAARLFAAASRWREVLGVPMRSFNRAAYQAALDAIRARLDFAAFASAWLGGRALTLDAAVAEALAGDTPTPAADDRQEHSEAAHRGD